MYKERVLMKVVDDINPKPINQTIEILPDELLSLNSTTSGTEVEVEGEAGNLLFYRRSLPPSNFPCHGKMYEERVVLKASDKVDDPKPINQTFELLPDEELSLFSITSGSGSEGGKLQSNQRSLRRSNIRRAGEESETETDSEESDVRSKDDDTSWISWFCNLRGNEFFCEVDKDFILDDFNLYGLNFPFYDNAIELILDVKFSKGDVFTEEENEVIKSTAVNLYGLIHARYILTSRGMAAMLEKYENVDFGRCPRGYCSVQPCLPVGQSDLIWSTNVKIYCPKCEDIYFPRSEHQGNVDGAFFGTTFPHLFFMTYPHLKPKKRSKSYTPRMFGFKLHKP